MTNFWDRLFDFLEKNLPGLLAAFSLGYSRGDKKSVDLQNEVDDLKLAIKKEQNLETVEKANAGKSDADILRDSIKRQSDQG